MKPYKLALVIGLLLFTGCLAANATTAHANHNYVVQRGDTLWDLANKSSEPEVTWEYLYTHPDNAFLRERGRRRADSQGRIIVRLNPGEVIAGLNRSGEVMPDTRRDQIVAAQAANPTRRIIIEETWPWWMWWVIAVLAILAIVLSARASSKAHDNRRLREREAQRAEREASLNQNPVTSGPPVVEGGLPTPEAAREHMLASAVRAYVEETGRTASPETFRVVSIESGRGWGVVGVDYADQRNQMRRLSGERIYRAEIRWPDGTIEFGYCLQACGNDLRFHGRLRYHPEADFRWEADAPATVPAAPDVVPAANNGHQPSYRLEYQGTTDSQPVILEGDGHLTITIDKKGVVRIHHSPRPA